MTAPVLMLVAVAVSVGAVPALTVVAVSISTKTYSCAPPNTVVPFHVARVVTAAYSVRILRPQPQ